MIQRRHVELSAPAGGAICAPLVVAFALALYVVTGWVRGGNPFWSYPDLNVAEAAMVRDHAEVVRLIRAGQDPNGHWLIREEASDDGHAQLATALEAAVKIRRLELVQLLVREGATVTPQVRARLLDLAKTVGAPDIADYLRALQT